MKSDFLNFLKAFSTKFDNLLSNKVLILSSINEDALSAATLLLKHLYYSGVESHLSYLPVINENTIISTIKEYEDYNTIILLDTGSYFVDKLKLLDKNIVVFDHHILKVKDKKIGSIFQINPRMFGLDGSRDAPTSSVLYLLLKEISYYIDDIKYLSLVGMIGDLQEPTNEESINKQILNGLVNEGLISIEKGLKLFGLASKPLYKALELSMEVFVPGITGNEKNSISFLQSLRIPLKKKGSYITYYDLSKDDLKRLVSEIIKRRLMNNIEDADKILSDLYIVNDDKFVFRELHEISYVYMFSTLDKLPSIPIRYFLGETRLEDDINDYILNNKKKILDVLYKLYETEISVDKSGILLIDTSPLELPDLSVSVLSKILYLSNGLKSVDVPIKTFIVIRQTEDGTYISIKPKNGDFWSLTRATYKIIESIKDSYLLSNDLLGGVYIKSSNFEDIFKKIKIILRQENLI